MLKGTKDRFWSMFNSNKESGAFESTIISSATFTPLAQYDQPLEFNTLTVDKVKQFTETIIVETNNLYDRIAGLQPNELSFETVFRPQIELDDKLANLSCMATVMAQFSTDKALRDACNEAKEKLSEHGVEVSMREDVYKIVNTYHQNQYKKEKGSLTDEEKLIVKHWIRDYKRKGFQLDEATRKKTKQLQQKIQKNEIAFQKNLDDENTSFVFTKQQLEGLPESWFTEARKVDEGKYKATLKYPDYLPIMDSVKNRSVRKKMFTAFNSRCADTNQPLLDENLKLRHELAQLLGYEQYSDYCLEPKMAGTTEYVMNFLNDLQTQFKPLLHKDLEAFRQLAIEETGREDFTLESWDLRYYARINQERFCDLDMSKVQEYFPLQTVLKGMLSVYEKLLGLKFVQQSTDNKWHESVQYYRVFDYDHKHQHRGQEIGSFYLDLYPRDGKYGHAAAFDFIKGGDISTITKKKNDRVKPTMAMACNFPENECLQFDDVVTFFHEFGHIMHGICSKTQISSLGSFAVQDDFVEAPSQMLEFWCYVPEVLSKMSGHKDTGEPIPKDMIDKLVKEKQVNVGYSDMRQLSFGLFDMSLHTKDFASKRKINSNAQWQKISMAVTEIGMSPDTNMPASFGHLMGGYEAIYYGYMMSLTYATDMFYSNFKGHELDPIQGKRYRECILEPGGSKDAMELLKDFLGREPNMTAFLMDKGLENQEVQDTIKIKMNNKNNK